MEHFSKTVNGEEIKVTNVIMIQDEVTDVKDNVVMITQPEEGENHLTGEVLFEAKFKTPEDADFFYELLGKAEIVSVG